MTASRKDCGLNLRTPAQPPKLLTIAIPTYNREQALSKTLSALRNPAITSQVDVLVLDNGSTDGTFDVIREYSLACPGISACRFEENQGFAESFFRAIENVDSDYVLLLSDEDEVVAENLMGLLSFISERQPDFVSPQMFIEETHYKEQLLSGRLRVGEGRLYRGRLLSGRVRFEKVRDAASYLSGLVFRTSAANIWLPKVRELSTRELTAALYPQVVLSMFIASSGKALWFGEKIVFKRDQLRSEISDEGSRPYYDLSSRLEQFQSWSRVHHECLKSQTKQNTPWKRFEIRSAMSKHSSQLTEIWVHALTERGISRREMLTSTLFWYPLFILDERTRQLSQRLYSFFQSWRE